MVENTLNSDVVLLDLVLQLVVADETELALSLVALAASLQETEFRVVVHFPAELAGHVADVTLSFLGDVEVDVRPMVEHRKRR